MICTIFLSGCCGITGLGVFVHSSAEVLREISALMNAGTVTPWITQVFSFDQLALAQGVGDYSIVDKILTPDWQDIPLAPGQQEGAEGFIGLVKGFTQAFPDVKVHVHEIFGTHERAGVSAEMVFTHSSEFMGIPATHQQLTVAIHEFHHLREGRLEKTWHLEDWLTMLVKTGAWPVKGK